MMIYSIVEFQVTDESISKSKSVCSIYLFIQKKVVCSFCSLNAYGAQTDVIYEKYKQISKKITY